MAERRMFAKTIIDSDAFLDMPQSSQLLYFHLSMRADDEGFINNPKSIMRNVGCKEDDVKLLIAKKFIIPFESGIVVIKHWRIHNYIQKDRFTPTKYQDERNTLMLDENKSYTQCIQDVYKLDTQVSIGKDSIDKVSIVQDSIGEDRKEKKESLASIIGSYTDNLDLKSELLDYVEMRKKMKGFTLRALKLNLNELDKLSNNDQEKIEIVKQSISKSWKSFYPLKKDKTERTLPEWYGEKEEPAAKEPTKEDHIQNVLTQYDFEMTLEKIGQADEARLENLKEVYRGLTGRDIEEDYNEKEM